MTYSQKIAAITEQDQNNPYPHDFSVFEGDVYREAWSLTFAAVSKNAKAIIKAVIS